VRMNSFSGSTHTPEWKKEHTKGFLWKNFFEVCRKESQITWNSRSMQIRKTTFLHDVEFYQHIFSSSFFVLR
jgi:hypothetical protein